MVNNKYRYDDVGGQLIWIKSTARESARVVCKYTSSYRWTGNHQRWLEASSVNNYRRIKHIKPITQIT